MINSWKEIDVAAEKIKTKHLNRHTTSAEEVETDFLGEISSSNIFSATLSGAFSGTFSETFSCLFELLELQRSVG
jgi:hypothetical protein